MLRQLRDSRCGRFPGSLGSVARDRAGEAVAEGRRRKAGLRTLTGEPKSRVPSAHGRTGRPRSQASVLGLRELTDGLREVEASCVSAVGPRRSPSSTRHASSPRVSELISSSIRTRTTGKFGLWVAYDQYDGGAPAAGVVTDIGRVDGREVLWSRTTRR